MRQVAVFKDYRHEGKVRIGTFHGFSADHIEYESGPGNFPVAIVEYPDGTVEPAHVSRIVFQE